MTTETELTDLDSPSTKRKRAKRMSPSARREQVVSGAIQVCAEKGIAGTSHALVAEQVGVSTPTIFLYLPSRKTLIDTVLEKVEGYCTELVDEASSTEISAHGKLLSILRAWAVAIDTDTDYIRVWLSWSAAVHEETWPKYVAFQDRLLARFERIISDGKSSGEVLEAVNPAWASHQVYGSGNMIAQMKFRGVENQEIDNFLKQLITSMIGSIRTLGVVR